MTGELLLLTFLPLLLQVEQFDRERLGDSKCY